MALILNIDTSTDVCSVAIARDGNVIALKENDEGFNHSTLLGVYVDDLLKENNLTAVSYTHLTLPTTLSV